MSEFGRRFDPSELEDDGRRPPDGEAAGLLATARDLEAYARSDQAMPGIGFEDRVMAAVAAEAPPRALATGGGVTGMILALRDAWRITWSTGRPLAVRAQAFALVLIAAVAVSSVGSLATVGAIRLLDGTVPPAPNISPSPSPSTPPSPSPSPDPSTSPSPSPSTPPSPSPSPSPSPIDTSEPTETDAAGGTANPTDARETREPAETPEPDETAEPTETAEATDESSGSGSGEDSGSGSGEDSGSGSGEDSGSGSGSDEEP